MKLQKNDDLKGLCFTIIIIASIALTYCGSFAFPDASSSNVWERFAAIPAMATVYLFVPNMEGASLEYGWMGSVIAYFAIGVVILLVIQNWIQKGGGKKGGGPRI